MLHESSRVSSRNIRKDGKKVMANNGIIHVSGLRKESADGWTKLVA